MPTGQWLCPDCIAAGKTLRDAEKALKQREKQAQLESRPNIFPDAAMKRRDAAAASLHGRLITRVFKDPATKRPRSYWGKLFFRGAEKRPQYFLVMYEDGDQQHMSYSVALKYLKPESAVLPPGVVIPEPAIGVNFPSR